MKKRNYFWAIIFPLIVFTCSLLIVIGNFKSFYYAGGDQINYINPNLTADYADDTWDENGYYLLGGFTYSNISWRSFFFFFRLLSFLPILYREYLYFSLIFFLIFFSSYFYFKNFIFKEKFSAVISSLFYLFNLFFFTAYLNVPSQMSFILTPLMFILCHYVIDANYFGIIALSVICSIFIPVSFVNAPNGLASIGLVVIYAAYLFFEQKKYRQIKKTLFSLIFTIFYLFLINLWWLVPMFQSLFVYSYISAVKKDVVEFFATTSLHEAFRFLGGWAFNSYFLDPSNKELGGLVVKNPFFVFFSYLIVIISFCSVFFIKKNKKILFFLILAFLGLSLSKGSLSPWGNLYMFAWKNIPGMFGFREPYTKFIIIYVISLSCLFGYFYHYLKESLPDKLKKIVQVSLLVNILIVALPFTLGGFVIQHGIGAYRSFLIKIPDYLWDFRKLDSFEKLNYRLMVFPEANGAKAYNWEKGMNTVKSIISYFSTKPVFQNDQYRYRRGDEMAVETYNTFDSTTNSLLTGDLVDVKSSKLLLYLGILNIGNFTQENDLDWRWRNVDLSTRTPSEITEMFKLFDEKKLILKKADFGMFDKKYLKKIPNEIPNNWVDGSLLNEDQKKYLSDLLLKELENRPAISYYYLNRDYFVPQIYIPQKIFFSNQQPRDYFNLLNFKDYVSTYGFYFRGKNEKNEKAIETIKELVGNYSGDQSGQTKVEYKKLSPSKYKINLHKVRNIVPVIFSNAFDGGWKLYLNKLYRNPPVTDKEKIISDYFIFKGNEENQASQVELNSFLENNLIWDLGDLREKKLKHFTYKNGRENIEFYERYKINFISKDFKGTIQNDNLGKGDFWETWFPENKKFFIKSRSLFELSEETHLNVNGYANSWILNIDEICSGGKTQKYCIENSDDTFDLSLILEFQPQIAFIFSKKASLFFWVVGIAVLFCFKLSRWKQIKKI